MNHFNLAVDLILCLLIALVLLVLAVIFIMFKRVYKNKGIKNGEKVFENIEQKENEQLIAAIMGAISCYSDSKFKIKSIRRISQTTPSWGTAGRNDVINSRF